MRTITVNQLNTLVDQAFERLERYTTHPETCPWFSANSVELAESTLDAVRHKAQENIARYEEHPFRPYYSLSNVLACWTWWFVVVRRNNGGCPEDDVDVQFLAPLGAEVKRLGFQLASTAVAHEIIALKLKQAALGAWDDAIAYAFESSPAFLEPYCQESLVREESEYARARELRGDVRKTVEHVSSAFKHWGFWCALQTIMYKKHNVREAHDEFLQEVEAKIPCLQELKQVMDDPFFDEEFASVHPLFS